jgi:PAS domain S-box-containing protein
MRAFSAALNTVHAYFLRPRERTIPVRLALLMAAGILPLLGVAAALVIGDALDEQWAMRDRAGDTARAITYAVDREIAAGRALLVGLSTSPAFASGDLAVLYRQASDAVAGQGTHVVLSDPTGKILFNTSDPFGTAPRPRTDLAFHARTVATKRWQVSDLFRAARSGKQIVALDVPVLRGGGGEVAYVLTWSIPREVLYTALDRQAIPDGWLAGIFDRSGATIAWTGTLSEYGDALGRSEVSTGIPSGNAGSRVTIGDGRVPLFKAFNRSELSGWSAVVAMPEETLNAPVRRAIWLIASGGAVLLLALFAVRLYASRRIVRPLRTLEASARALGRRETLAGSATDLREINEVAAALRQAAAERDAAEAALRESQQRLRLALEAGRTGVWEIDFGAGVVSASETAAEIFGVPFTSTDGRYGIGAWHARVHPDDLNGIRRYFRQAMRRRADDYDIEYRIVRPDGAVRWIAVRGAVARNSRGKVVRSVGVVRDVTERKRAEETLRQSEERYRALAESIPELVWIIEPAGKGTYINPRCVEYTGLSAETLANEDCRVGLVHPDDLERVRTTLARRRGDREYQFEARLRRKDGQYRWHRIRGLPLRRSGEPAGGWLSTATDVDDLRQVELVLNDANKALEQRIGERTTQLAASEARERAYFDNSPDYLVLVRVRPNGEQVYEDLNPAAERLLGHRRDDMIGRCIAEILPPTAVTEMNAYTADCLKQGTPQHLVMHRNYGPGREHVVDAIIAPVPFTDGDDRFVLLCGRDVTEQHAVEEQLRQAQKLQAVGRLTGGVAHDFNNLLTVVLGNLDRIEQRARGRDDSLYGMAKAARHAAERGAQLTAQLLTFSRRQALQSASVMLDRLVAGIDDLLRRAAGERVEITIEAGQDLWPCRTDAAQFEAAVLNLVINARDAMMPKGGCLKLHVRNARVSSRNARRLGIPPGDYVCVSVSDTGPGMTPEVLARVFEPFFTTKDVGKGTGLGLSQVYGFTKQSGGTVVVDSFVGRGTTVTLYLPRASAGLASPPEAPTVGLDAAAAAAVSTGSAEAAASENRGTILLVEDQKDVLTLTSAVLSDLGYSVVPASGGAEARSILEGPLPIDLLFTDVMMPGEMSGHELARRAQELRPNLPVLLTSGHPEGCEPVTTADRFGTIRKPYRASELAKAISALLDSPARLQSSGGGEFNATPTARGG